MEVKKYKNLFCLCAVKGCKHIGTVDVKIKTGDNKQFQNFTVCQQCSFDLLLNKQL